MTLNRQEDKPEILRDAVNAFQRITGKNLQIEAKAPKIMGNTFIRFRDHGVNERYVAQIKKRLTKETLGAAVHQLNQLPEKGILIAPYINPRMADRLKDMGVQFLDTAGNAYFNAQPLFIFLKGNKTDEGQKKAHPARALQTVGLKVLFALICNPELINGTYREIAGAADVALGSIGLVLKDLIRGGYVVDLKKKGRRLVERKKLIHRWVEFYPEQLKPKLIIGRFEPGKEFAWNKINLPGKKDDFEVFWGGETAAAKLTNYLKPEIYTAYIKRNPNRFILNNKLKKDPQGTLELLKVFWNFEVKGPHPNTVPPLLIYADLLATGDARNLETAKIIYEKELARFIEEDQ